MKVSELIEQLQGLDQAAEVHFAYNYGDYWRTIVAPPVKRVTEACVTYSEYHNMDEIALGYGDDPDEEVDEFQAVREVVVLR